MNRFYDFHYRETDPVVKIDQDAIIGDKVPCPVDPYRHSGTGWYRINDLVVKLKSPKVRDVSSTWHNDYLITDRVASLFKEAGFAGYNLRHVDVRLPQSVRYEGIRSPVLWEFKVDGWGGVAPESSGIKLVTRCSVCTFMYYTPLLHPEKLIDESQWDGSDFFFVWPLPGFILVTARVKTFVEGHRLQGVNLIPVEQMRCDKYGFSPGRLRYHMDPERAKKLGGHLGID